MIRKVWQCPYCPHQVIHKHLEMHLTQLESLIADLNESATWRSPYPPLRGSIQPADPDLDDEDEDEDPGLDVPSIIMRPR